MGDTHIQFSCSLFNYSDTDKLERSHVKASPCSLTSEHRRFGVTPLVEHGEDEAPLVGAGVKSFHSVESHVPVKAPHSVQLPMQSGGAHVTPAKSGSPLETKTDAQNN